jgi:hypothetical protein
VVAIEPSHAADSSPDRGQRNNANYDSAHFECDHYPSNHERTHVKKKQLTGPRMLLAACTIICGLLAAGCSSSGHQPGVASLPTARSSSSHGSTNASGHANDGIPDPDGRPRDTLNQTRHQITVLMAPFNQCVARHHGLTKAGLYESLGVCKRYEPLVAWQVDPTNPQARSFIGRTVACIRSKGYDAAAAMSRTLFGENFWTVQFTPATVGIGSQAEAAQDVCQQQALH